MCAEWDILRLYNKQCQCSLVDNGDNGNVASKIFLYCSFILQQPTHTECLFQCMYLCQPIYDPDG